MANTQILKQEIGRGYIAHALDYDAQGKAFLAIARADTANPNITFVDVWMAERGQPFPEATIGRAQPQLKIDALDLDHTGSTLVVSMTTHAPQEAPRPTAVEAYTIPNVWATSAGFEAERGGPGGFTGEGETSVEVDYGRIQAGVHTEVDAAKHWVKDQLTYYIQTETVPAIVQQVATRLAGDPGPVADLLYKRIADGTWEQLDKWQKQKGYKPNPTP